MSDKSYDAIVVGGGHNGLVCAAYLARAGRRVCVLERRPLLGGACVTEEVWPGYRVSRASYVLSLLQPKVIRELRLAEHGLRVRVCDPSWGTITAAGQPIVFWEGEPERTRAEIAAVSKADAARWPEWERMLGRVADVLRPLLLMQPPPGDMLRALGTAGKTLGLRRRDLADTMRLMTMSVGDLLDDWFENDALKGSIASSGVVGVWAGPRTPGTAYNLLHHSVGEVNGVVGAWGQVEGGMGAVSEAVARAARAWGADIRTSAGVTGVDVSGGRVRGVTLESGERLEAPVVASAIHPKTLVLDLVGREHWPGEVVSDIERYRTRGGAVKINMVVSDLPQWRGIEASRPRTRVARRRLCRLSLDRAPGALVAARPDGRDGAGVRLHRGAHAVGRRPEPVDEGLPGHVMSLYTQFGPPQREIWTDAARDAYASAAMELLRTAAPNMTDSVIMHREVLAPPDLEDVFGSSGATSSTASRA